MHVLRNVTEGIVPGGALVEVQSVRPWPRIEVGDRVAGVIDATAFFERADANNAVLERWPPLRLEAEDAHEVRTRADSGPALVAWFEGKARPLSDDLRGALLETPGPCALREGCRTRRFRVLAAVQAVG